MKVVSFDRSSLKREVQIFSANFACLSSSESSELFKDSAPRRTVIGNLELNWQQGIQLSVWLLFYLTQFLAKAH
jgi:hypothetical protein